MNYWHTMPTAMTRLTLKLRKRWHWSKVGVFQTETAVDTKWSTVGTNRASSCWRAPEHPKQYIFLHYISA